MVATVQTPPRESERVVLNDASWELYERLVEEAGNKRLTYDKGVLEIMSPLPIHEIVKTMLGGMVELLALELAIPMARFGSTTFKIPHARKGLEPDECYYVQNALAVRGLDHIDFAVHPPPDLAIEVDITSRSVPRLPIYAAMGVAEIWRYDGETLHTLHLIRQEYRAGEMSLAFPMLRPADLVPFLKRVPADDPTDVLRAYQQWVRERFVR